MHVRMDFTALAFALTMASSPLIAQDTRNGPGTGIGTGIATGAPGVVTQGSGTVSVGGQSAARAGDTDDRNSPNAGGSPDVMINGRPAATVGDRTGCGGVVVGGSSNVFINGKPAARAGDMTTGC